MKGKQRCRLHGGKSPKGKQLGKENANHKHGLYSACMNDAEKAAWDDIPLGHLDAEIKMCRIWLARAGALDLEISKDANSTKHMAGFELTEIRQTADARGKSVDTVSRRPDLMHRVNVLLGRIAQLEKIRAELLTAAAGKEDLSVRFVVEIPAEEPMEEWIRGYGANGGKED